MKHFCLPLLLLFALTLPSFAQDPLSEADQSPGRASIIAGSILLGMAGVFSIAAGAGYHDARQNLGYSRRGSIKEGSIPWLAGGVMSLSFSVPLIISGLRQQRAEARPVRTEEESSGKMNLRSIPKE